MVHECFLVWSPLQPSTFCNFYQFLEIQALIGLSPPQVVQKEEKKLIQHSYYLLLETLLAVDS